MDNYELKNNVSENFKYLSVCLKNSNWAATATPKTIDSIFNCALQLEKAFSDKYNEECEKLVNYYPIFKTEKPADVLLQNVIQNQNLSQQLTLYAIKKYASLYSVEACTKLLEKILAETELRSQIFNIVEKFPDVDLDFYRLNNLIHDIQQSSDCKSKIIQLLKTQPLIFLKAIQLSTFLNGQSVVDELIQCLESQTDLRLWFIILKDENLETVLDLCVIYRDFLDAVFKFFDKFAFETESNYDEELNVQYSHVNLDFEEFVKIIQLFLNKPGIKKVTCDFLDNKNLTEKNFCFWTDVKACLEVM